MRFREAAAERTAGGSGSIVLDRGHGAVHWKSEWLPIPAGPALEFGPTGVLA
jgi:hypothetical protein